MKTMTGKIRGKMIELDDPHEFDDGTEVEITVSNPVKSEGATNTGDGELTPMEATIADDPQWDIVQGESQNARRPETL